MKKLLLIAVLISNSAGYAQGVWTEGAIDCGLWAKARKADGAQYFEHFLMGTVNGIVLGTFKDVWGGVDGIKVSREQLYLWMDGWCLKNPLSYVHIGAWDFAIERTNGAVKINRDAK